MKLILLTGLDGSGKSTLLNRLEKIALNKPIAFIRVPKIDSHFFRGNQAIYNATLFINEMHVKADCLKKPQLKVIALFSSMLLFKKLLQELNQSHIKFIFCERHPLIDTGVYAKFYTDKMDPSTISKELLFNIEEKYTKEIGYILSLVDVEKTNRSNIYILLQYIHNWFTINKKHTLNDLKELFDINLPDKIIYLSATPEVLIKRLKNREVLEAHESKETFEKLIPVYEKVLIEASVITEKIDANSFINLDAAFEKLKKNIIEKCL